jgi:hypothetical protein
MAGCRSEGAVVGQGNAVPHHALRDLGDRTALPDRIRGQAYNRCRGFTDTGYTIVECDSIVIGCAVSIADNLKVRD